MKKLLLFSFVGLSLVWNANAQQYKDGFNDDGSAPTAPYWGTAPTGFTVAHTAGSGTTTLTGDGGSGTYASISYDPYDNPDLTGSGTQIAAVDMSGTNDTIFVVAKSTVAGSLLRIDVKDANDYVSNAGGTLSNQKALTTSYAVYKFFYGGSQDGAYGGTGCASGPCTVDLSTIKEFLFYVDASTGAFNGTVTIDYFQVGGNSSTVTVTDVKAAQQIASSKIYPNPTSDKANIDLSLKSESNLKITLTDMLGKQVDAIETTGSAFNGSFNTSNLNKGMYTVNYYVNGQPAKAELLLVK